MNNIRYKVHLGTRTKGREKGGLLGKKGEGNDEGNKKILAEYIVLNILLLEYYNNVKYERRLRYFPVSTRLRNQVGVRFAQK